MALNEVNNISQKKTRREHYCPFPFSVGVPFFLPFSQVLITAPPKLPSDAFQPFSKSDVVNIYLKKSLNFLTLWNVGVNKATQ